MADSSIINQKLSLSDTVFTKATPEQRLAAWRLNGVSWAAPMSVDEYVLRETNLSEQDLTKEAGCDYWILHHKDDEEHIIASCEATRKTVFVAGKSRFTEGTGYAIASVYTNPEYRRLGMASYMLQKLQEYMDSSEGNGTCSALYSDIGTVYYANLGWPVFPSEQATIHLQGLTKKPDVEKLKEAYTLPDTASTRFLGLEDLPALCEKDTTAMRTHFQGELKADLENTHVAFAPTFPQIAWQLARGQFMAGKMYNKTLINRGAITADGSSWIYWDHDWREMKLKIMRIVTALPPVSSTAVTSTSGEPLPQMTEEQQIRDVVLLLRAAAAEASAWGLGKLLVWNPDVRITRAIKALDNVFEGSEMEIVFDQRLDGSIPSLRWRGGGSMVGTVWDDNQYYCWC